MCKGMKFYTHSLRGYSAPASPIPHLSLDAAAQVLRNLHRRPPSRKRPSSFPRETANPNIFFYKISGFSKSNKYLPFPISKQQQLRESEKGRAFL